MLFVAAQDIKEARRIVADFAPQFAQRDELARTRRHLHFLAAAIERHELHQPHVQTIARLAHRDETRANARDVAVVIRAEHVDQLVESALALVQVVRDVGGEVGLDAVFAHDDAVLFVAEVRGAEPFGPVFLVDDAVPAQQVECMLDRAIVGQAAFAEPAVEPDTELVKVLADVGEDVAERQVERLPKAIGAEQRLGRAITASM